MTNDIPQTKFPDHVVLEKKVNTLCVISLCKTWYNYKNINIYKVEGEHIYTRGISRFHRFYRVEGDCKAQTYIG